ncbi:MAG: hypothetical protein LUQ38_10545 [Methanotrichaceae archaeon]|nr:hypothetical protein [Methanotrichaceae archaeon]MDD1757415.1 hypothetical protein [Methanotrichaceae archaeon]
MASSASIEREGDGGGYDASCSDWHDASYHFRHCASIGSASVIGGSSFQDPALDLLSPLIAAVLLVLYISDHFSIPPTAVSRE